MGKSLHTPSTVMRFGHSFEDVKAVLVDNPHLHGSALEIPVKEVQPSLVPHPDREIVGVRAIPVEGPELIRGLFRAILEDKTEVLISSMRDGDDLQPVVAELIPDQAVHLRRAA